MYGESATKIRKNQWNLLHTEKLYLKKYTSLISVMKRILAALLFSLSFVGNSCITKQIVSALSEEEQKLQLQQDEKKIGKEFVVRLHRSAPYQSPQQFQAGAAEIDITPWA